MKILERIKIVCKQIKLSSTTFWNWIRLQSLKIISAFLVLISIGILGSFPNFSDIFLFLIIDVFVEFFFEISVQSKKIYLRQENDFNVDYFDLYWGYFKIQISFLAKTFAFVFPVTKNFVLTNCTYNSISRIVIIGIVGVIVFLVVVIISAFIFTTGRTLGEIWRLTLSKGENYSSYTEDEKLIISNLNKHFN